MMGRQLRGLLVRLTGYMSQLALQVELTHFVATALSWPREPAY